MKRCWVVLLVLCLGCGQKEKVVRPAFYHWQTVLQLSDVEEECLAQLKVQKLYVKFFDVDWDATRMEAVPLASLESPQPVNDKIEIIPVVFITNRTLVNISEKEIAKLSQQIHRKIKTIWRSFSEKSIREIQFDCDWTQSTKEKYFAFLEQFQKQDENKNYLLSATIRLHQIKFPNRTGIPPVDRGMLMFYNTGDLENRQTANSILDLTTATQYVNANTTYRLPLDLALPIFRWGVLFRNGEMIKLINNLDISELQDTSRFTALAVNQYQVIKSTYLKGYYLYASDELRLESISIEHLNETAGLLKEVFSNNDLTIVFYHMDTMTIKHYTYEELQNVFQIFRD